MAEQTVLGFPMPVGQRRRTPEGKALHCCSVCQTLSTWGKGWSWYGSYKEIDDGVPVFKACSEKCKKLQPAVTEEMMAEARAKEFYEAAHD